MVYMKHGSCTDIISYLTKFRNLNIIFSVYQCFIITVLPACDDSSVCWSWAGGEGGRWRSSLWVRLCSSVERGCCCWAGRLSWASGSPVGGRDPKSPSRACSLREGLWKQKQNIASRDADGQRQEKPERCVVVCVERVFSVSHAAWESCEVLWNNFSLSRQKKYSGAEAWLGRELQDEVRWVIASSSWGRNESKGRIQHYEQAVLWGWQKYEEVLKKQKQIFDLQILLDRAVIISSTCEVLFAMQTQTFLCCSSPQVSVRLVSMEGIWPARQEAESGSSTYISIQRGIPDEQQYQCDSQITGSACLWVCERTRI